MENAENSKDDAQQSSGDVRPPAEPPAPIPPPPGENENSDGKNNAARKCVKPEKNWEKIHSIITLVLSFFTLIVLGFQTRILFNQLGFMSGQLREMKATTEATTIAADAAKKSAEVSESAIKYTIESFQIDQRPYVVIDGIQVLTQFSPNQEFRISVVYKNTGKTPAFNFRFNQVISIGDANLFVRPILEEKRDTPPITIASSQTTSGVSSVSANQNTYVVYNSVIEEKYKIYIYGLGTYTDVFGKSHRTFYSYIINLKNGLGEVTTDGNRVE